MCHIYINANGCKLGAAIKTSVQHLIETMGYKCYECYNAGIWALSGDIYVLQVSYKVLQVLLYIDPPPLIIMQIFSEGSPFRCEVPLSKSFYIGGIALQNTHEAVHPPYQRQVHSIPNEAKLNHDIMIRPPSPIRKRRPNKSIQFFSIFPNVTS